MDAESSYILKRTVSDIVVLFCVAFPLLGIYLWVTPAHRGYIQGDTSLMLPYKGETVSEEVLAVVGFAVNVLAIVVLEIAHTRKTGSIVARRRLFRWNVPVWAWEIYQVVGVLLFGACCQQLTTSLGKNVMGSLRPFFFDVCDPVPVAAEATNIYVENYTCRGTNASLLREMRLSFPSAHAAFAAYAAIFFSMYLYKRLVWGSLLLRNGLIFLAVLCAWYVGLSRIIDHKHHGFDVAAGFLIGAVYAVLVFLYVSHIGREPERIQWDGDLPRVEQSFRRNHPHLREQPTTSL